jgi:hypothetical protein
MRLVGRIVGFVIGAIAIAAPITGLLVWIFDWETVVGNSRFGVFVIGAGMCGAAVADRIRMRILRWVIARRACSATPSSSRD